MYLYHYEELKLIKVKYDPIREFCLCENVNEEYMRSLIKQDSVEEGDIIKLGEKRGFRISEKLVRR